MCVGHMTICTQEVSGNRPRTSWVREAVSPASARRLPRTPRAIEEDTPFKLLVSPRHSPSSGVLVTASARLNRLSPS